MATRRTYNPARKNEVFDTLRREILAARLKVTLDEELKRETSPTVMRLAQMKLPPIVRSNNTRFSESAPASAPRTSRERHAAR